MGFDEPHGGTWHGGYVGRGWVLHNGVATAVVDGFETLGTVFVGTSEYYAQALLSPRFGSRGQGVVYGWAAKLMWGLDGEGEGAVELNEEVVVGWCQIDVTTFYGVFVARLNNSELGLSPEALHKARADMLKAVHADDYGQTEIIWQASQYFRHHSEAACRPSYHNCLIFCHGDLL